LKFAYDNDDLINLLKKRGGAIKTGNWKQVNKIDEEINTLKNAEEHARELSEPVAAFVTFNYASGADFAVKY
jgi:hypothetical protein